MAQPGNGGSQRLDHSEWPPIVPLRRADIVRSPFLDSVPSPRLHPVAECRNCGQTNPEGYRFCAWCGAMLTSACPNCGAETLAGSRFCGVCGSSLAGDESSPAARPSARPPPVAPGPVAERRLVSALFLDLVGFTTYSEERDPEEVRELLTRYFDTARRVVELYGGTIEKFIGDAVMAVWGTPVAREDDAERAVRAALELCGAVEALGAEAGTDLRARAGVLTGEAAVSLGATGQGMVAGDLVNTASRIQSIAVPGSVLVGEATRRATEAAIVYEESGVHELKGKAEPVTLWRAVRVVAGIGGAYRSTGLEAPFVGRDRELRLVKELFHDSAGEKRAHLVSVVGIAGIGKSRLSWEFFKYLEGLAGVALWHRGRCLSYGDGVTYWALAEMVKMRCRIAEGEESGSALAKLRATLDTYITDAEERRWVEPRVAHLLGLEEREAREREDLFAAWRVFFERLADSSPTVMVFEDLQWADRALLDFIEYLLEWSRNHSLFVMTLARPELADRVPGWGASRRNFTSLFPEPLSNEAMKSLLAGLAPGLPEEVEHQVLARAEGVPLYAVETVRMLIDRGLLVQEGASYRPVGPIGALDVPETLHALIAARLDGLTADERQTVQDAAVLGKTFTRQALAAIRQRAEADIEPVLAALVRKEVLGLQVDPRSPERGQYGFLQDLVRRVAYETLSRKERKSLHLAAARTMEESWAAEEDEVVEILASHYIQAYEALPDAPDAADIKNEARLRLERAGRRAAGLAANADAQRYFEQALALADTPRLQAELAEQAGQMARNSALNDQAAAHYDRAIRLFGDEGLISAAARVEARLADVLWDDGRIEEAVERLERAFEILSTGEPDEVLATVASQLARFHYFAGHLEVARERIEVALDIAEPLELPLVLAHSLNTKSVILGRSGRFEEALALLVHALKIALDNDLYQAALRAYINLSATLVEGRLRYEEGLRYAMEGLALARKVGSRWQEWGLLSHITGHLIGLGRWDEALSWAKEIPSPTEVPAAAFPMAWTIPGLVEVAVQRGEIAHSERLLEELMSLPQATADEQNRSTTAWTQGFVRAGEGRWKEAFGSAMEAASSRETAGGTLWSVQLGAVLAMEAAFQMQDVGKLEGLIAEFNAWPRIHITPLLRAQLARMSARLAARRGDVPAAEEGFDAAIALFRKMSDPFALGEPMAELGELLVSEGRVAEAAPLLSEAREIFEQLGARPWLERIEHMEETLPRVASGV
jgi:class 3 adenylate cyclase/tetratricopeptide (TPR) repeat protein